MRMLTETARGSPDRTGRRSTSTDSTPLRASAIAVVSPAGPAPTMSTGARSPVARFPGSCPRPDRVGGPGDEAERVIFMTSIGRLSLTFIRHDV